MIHDNTILYIIDIEWYRNYLYNTIHKLYELCKDHDCCCLEVVLFWIWPFEERPPQKLPPRHEVSGGARGGWRWWCPLLEAGGWPRRRWTGVWLGFIQRYWYSSSYWFYVPVFFLGFSDFSGLPAVLSMDQNASVSWFSCVSLSALWRLGVRSEAQLGCDLCAMQRWAQGGAGDHGDLILYVTWHGLTWWYDVVWLV